MSDMSSEVVFRIVVILVCVRGAPAAGVCCMCNLHDFFFKFNALQPTRGAERTSPPD